MSIQCKKSWCSLRAMWLTVPLCFLRSALSGSDQMRKGSKGLQITGLTCGRLLQADVTDNRYH